MAQPLTRLAASRLGQHAKLLKPFQDKSKQLPALSAFFTKGLASSTPPKKILSLSMILLQDGLDVQELPVIIRRTDNTMFPFTNQIFLAGENVKPATDADKSFKHNLQQCKSASEVFKLLEIPGDQVTGYSASYALQRLCQLKDANDTWDDLDTFICTAVMNELYTTVRKEVSTLSNETLHSLVRCFLNSENFSEQCAECVKEEIEKRIADSKYTIQELCTLSNTLTFAPQYETLVDIIWVHIGSNYRDIDQSEAAIVLSSLPHSYKYITKLMEKQMRNFWWKLSGPDMSTILSSFVRLNVFCGLLMKNCGKWLSLNIQDVRETDLMRIVTAYIHFGFSDVILMRTLERYVLAKASKLDTNLLSLVMEYCRGRRYLSPRIFDVAALHFCDNSESYGPLQILSVLRPFGQLNYLPPKSMEFLLEVEKVLGREFDNIMNMEIVHVTELLSAFACVKKIPTNFAKRVLNPTFISRMKLLEDGEKAKAGRWMEMFQSAIILETRGVTIPLLYKQPTGFSHQKSEITKNLTQRIYNVLQDMLGANCLKKNTLAQKTVYPIDIEIYVKDRQAMEHSEISKYNCDVRLALIMHTPEHFCVNTEQLLGEHAMRNRHLPLVDYKVIQIHQEDIAPFALMSEKRQYLQKKLSPYLDF